MNLATPTKTEGAVLVVDDADIMRATCQRALERAGYQVLAAASGEEALQFFRDRLIEVAVLDIRMPGISGMELLREIKAKWPSTEVVMMTAFADTAIAEESLNLGASAFMVKPFDNIRILTETVNKAMYRIRIRRGEGGEDGPFFEEILRRSGLVSEDEMAQARTVAEKGGFTLRQALSTVKPLTPEQMDWAIANYLDLPYVRLSEKMLDPELIRNFPAPLAHTYACLPLFRSGDELHLVIANPFHPQAAAAIEQALQVKAILSKGSEPEIRSYLARYYGPPPELGVPQLLAKLQDEKTPEREKLLLELFRRVHLEQVMGVQIRELGPDQFELQVSARLRTGK